jgi:hypothetical protein
MPSCSSYRTAIGPDRRSQVLAIRQRGGVGPEADALVDAPGARVRGDEEGDLDPAVERG